jgi:hypothetical protein
MERNKEEGREKEKDEEETEENKEKKKSLSHLFLHAQESHLLNVAALACVIRIQP